MCGCRLWRWAAVGGWGGRKHCRISKVHAVYSATLAAGFFDTYTVLYCAESNFPTFSRTTTIYCPRNIHVYDTPSSIHITHNKSTSVGPTAHPLTTLLNSQDFCRSFPLPNDRFSTMYYVCISIICYFHVQPPSTVLHKKTISGPYRLSVLLPLSYSVRFVPGSTGGALKM